MAKVKTSAWAGGMSGAIGDSVLVQTQDGVVMRSRPVASKHRSLAQMEQAGRLAIVNLAWDSLSFEQAQAWRAYALRLATRNPATGGLRVPRAFGLFTGLSTKYLQIHGGRTVPSLPPEGTFNGDLLEFTVTGGTNKVTFVANGTNAEGVLTELLTQPLSGPNNLPKAKSYVGLGFFTFVEGVPHAVTFRRPGTWALARRFVEASTGRMTEMVEIGRATVTGEWI